MRRMLTAGEFYLGDRNDGADFGLFDELDALGCGYVLRLQNTVKWEVVESHPLSPEAIARGVTLDATVRLGRSGVVPCRHGFAESREGVLIQIYLCLIKALLLAELTGRKPNNWQDAPGDGLRRSRHSHVEAAGAILPG